MASSFEISLCPIEITLALLCSLASFAVSIDQQRAQRTPLTLFAAIASPFPLPPRTIAKSASELATAAAAGIINFG